MFQDQNILADRCTREPLFIRRRCKRGLQGADRGKIEVSVAPLQQPDRLKSVAFKRLHQFGLERITAAGGTERSVARRAAGTTGDLRKLARIELAELVAVELAVGGKGDVVDIEVEAHADGIGCYQVVDVARLVEGDLRVARARRKR